MTKKTGPLTKEQRLAAKLRENLSRRKAQMRARKASGADPAEVTAPPVKRDPG